MPGKHLTTVVRHFTLKRQRAAAVQNLAELPTHSNSRQRPGVRRPSAACVLGLFFFAVLALQLRAQETNSVASGAKFLGSQTCSSSSCHGGAGEKSKQFTIWSTHDFHHARPYATLETARSERIAEVLKIGNPTQSARCTVCHAPFATVPAERLGHDVAVTEGVSCESCHGPAENWIRSHTRPDYTHADRVATGMRDLKNLYVRANTCVACHQNIDPEIRAAGHPELIFELDGQSVTMPRHWQPETPEQHVAIWYTGQLVALREMSWQLVQTQPPTPDLTNRWSALVWLMRHAWIADQQPVVASLDRENIDSYRVVVDEYARLVGRGSVLFTSNAELTRRFLSQLASTSPDFKDKSVSPEIQARRAERLVLALDRLAIGANIATNTAVNQSLNKLFADAQSLPDFNPDQFANDLNTFHSSVAGFLETK